jgi:hypothetical protein
MVNVALTFFALADAVFAFNTTWNIFPLILVGLVNPTAPCLFPTLKSVKNPVFNHVPLTILNSLPCEMVTPPDVTSPYPDKEKVNVIFCPAVTLVFPLQDALSPAADTEIQHAKMKIRLITNDTIFS